MANIQEKIVAFLPEVVFEEGQYPTFTVPAEKLPALARYLRDEDELQFDNLAALVGVDWGETLGVVYYLNSVKYNHWVILKAVAADRKDPLLYSVSDIWENANFEEREVYDFYGIRFIGHPDMRRIFLREDWVGYPMRKDYDTSRENNPIPETNEECADTYDHVPYFGGQNRGNTVLSCLGARADQTVLFGIFQDGRCLRNVAGTVHVAAVAGYLGDQGGELPLPQPTDVQLEGGAGLYFRQESEKGVRTGPDDDGRGGGFRSGGALFQFAQSAFYGHDEDGPEGAAESGDGGHDPLGGV